MSSKQKKPECELCQCEECCKQIPESTALTFEGADYVRHFCDTKCYEKWQKKQHEQAQE